MSGLLGAVVCGVLAGLFWARGGLPGGAVVGAILGSGLYNLVAPNRAWVPGGLDLVVQITVGVLVGCTFNRDTLRAAVQVVPLAVLGSIALLGTTALLGLAVARWTGIDLKTAVFGFAPGGISGLALTAKAEGADPAVVSVMQTVRVVVIFVLVPLVTRWLK